MILPPMKLTNCLERRRGRRSSSLSGPQMLLPVIQTFLHIFFFQRELLILTQSADARQWLLGLVPAHQGKRLRQMFSG
jgi:hypothetical protein